MGTRLLGLWALPPVALLCAVACGGSAFETTGVGGAGAHAGAAGTATGGSTGVAGSASTAGSASHAGSGHGGGSAGAIGSAGAGGSDTQACASSTDCVLVSQRCCSCGEPDIAVNSYYAAARCGAVDCAPCPSPPPGPNASGSYLAAVCQAGRCTALDLRTTDIVQCTTAADCALRLGTGCCQPCVGGPPIAINWNKEEELEQKVCGSQAVACPPCLPFLFGSAKDCRAGLCTVTSLMCTPDAPCPL